MGLIEWALLQSGPLLCLTLKTFHKKYHRFHAFKPLFMIFPLPGKPFTPFLPLEISNYLLRHRLNVPSWTKSPPALPKDFFSFLIPTHFMKNSITQLHLPHCSVIIFPPVCLPDLTGDDFSFISVFSPQYSVWFTVVSQSQ